MQPIESGSTPEGQTVPAQPADVESAVPTSSPAVPPAFAPPPPPPPSSPRPNRRWLRPLAGTALMCLVLTVVASAVVLVPGGGPKTSPAGSPEAVVRAWWQAEQAGNQTLADSYLTARALQDGDVEMFGLMPGDQLSLTIQSSSIQGDRATVHTTMSMTGASDLPGFSADLPMDFTLLNDGGSWKIDSIGPGPTY